MANKLLLDRLSRLQRDECFVEIYRQSIESEPLVGTIASVSQDYCAIWKLSDSVAYGGLTIVRVDDITRLTWGGNELEAEQQLMQAAGGFPPLPDLDMGDLTTMLQSLQSAYGHVSVYTEMLSDDTPIVGEVEHLQDNALLLHAFGSLKSRDRHRVLVYLTDVTRIGADGPRERELIAIRTV